MPSRMAGQDTRTKSGRKAIAAGRRVAGEHDAFQVMVPPPY